MIPDTPALTSLPRWAQDSNMAAAATEALSRGVVMLDDGNEFGERHFMMPSNLQGFGDTLSARDRARLIRFGRLRWQR